MISNKSAAKIGKAYIINTIIGEMPRDCLVGHDRQNCSEEGVQLIVLGPCVPHSDKRTPSLLELMVYNDGEVEIVTDKRRHISDAHWDEMMGVELAKVTKAERLVQLRDILTQMDKTHGYVFDYKVGKIQHELPIQVDATMTVVGKFDKPRIIQIVLALTQEKRKDLNRAMNYAQRETVIVLPVPANYSQGKMANKLHDRVKKMRINWGCRT